MSLSFSSEAVCRSLASRDIKNRNAFSAIYYSMLVRLKPVADRLIERGKLPRGEARTLVTNLVTQMKQNDKITAVEKINLSIKSSDETFGIDFIAGHSVIDYQLGMMPGAIVIDRRMLMLCLYDPQVILHQHVLSRYMERTRKDTTTLFRDVGDNLRIATALSAFLPHGAGIAVPLSSGILLGTVVDRPAEVFQHSVDAKNGFSDPEVHQYSDQPRKQINAKTFIDLDSLGSTKSALYEKLQTYALAVKEDLKFIPLHATPATEDLRLPSLALFDSHEWKKTFT